MQISKISNSFAFKNSPKIKFGTREKSDIGNRYSDESLQSEEKTKNTLNNTDILLSGMVLLLPHLKNTDLRNYELDIIKKVMK